MGLNVGEANAVNTVIQALFGKPDAMGQPPNDERLRVALELLAQGAHKTIMCGINVDQVRELHEERVAALEEFRRLVDLAEDTSDMDSDIEVGRLDDVKNHAWRLLGLQETS